MDHTDTKSVLAALKAARQTFARSIMDANIPAEEHYLLHVVVSIEKALNQAIAVLEPDEEK